MDQQADKKVSVTSTEDDTQIIVRVADQSLLNYYKFYYFKKTGLFEWFDNNYPKWAIDEAREHLMSEHDLICPTCEELMTGTEESCDKCMARMVTAEGRAEEELW